jgi:hypothetical protein
VADKQTSLLCACNVRFMSYFSKYFICVQPVCTRLSTVSSSKTARFNWEIKQPWEIRSFVDFQCQLDDQVSEDDDGIKHFITATCVGIIWSSSGP